jgi:hypothetical protein
VTINNTRDKEPVTHSRESLDSLRQLLGHSPVETTAGYRHPAIDSASNPLDDLLTPRD